MMISSIKVQIGIFLIYLLTIVGILAIKLLTPLNNLLLHGKLKTLQKNRNFTEVLVSVTVPKKWFNHYYVSLFVYCMVIQYADLSKFFIIEISLPSIYKNLKIIHYLVWFQAARRCIECYTFTNYSPASTINFSHYSLGMLHYFIISLHLGLLLAQVTPQEMRLTIIDYSLIVLFVLASFSQSYNHFHLSTLIKYTLPKFKQVSSPHYLNEIQIYLIIMIFAIKDLTSDWLIGANFIVCWVFVVTNLSISALETWKFYKVKFGDKFKMEYAVIPGVI